jgi:hypothetical protein
MFRKLFLAGGSPPRLPGAGPGEAIERHDQRAYYIVLKEKRHGH